MPFRRLSRSCLRPGLALSLGLASALACQAQQTPPLPDLGSSADALVSPQQARLWGQAMFRQLRRLDRVLDDPLLDEQLQDLGQRLVAASHRPASRDHFFVVKDAQINAYAAPGGYIAVNSGLILLTHHRAELASVLAHEIGHLTQDHLQRSFEQARHSTPLLGLVLLGAIAAGASGAGDAGIATLAGGQGLLLQQGINFSRAEEAEADQAGMEILARAGFDPAAMADFFARLADQLRTDGSERAMPALLQDHPVTSQRIADARTAAEQLRRRPASVPAPSSPPLAASLAWPSLPWLASARSAGPRSSPAVPIRATADADYLYLRERVRVLSGSSGALDRYYQARRHAGPLAPAEAYGLALNQIRQGRGELALQQLKPLQQAAPDDLIIQLAVAAAELQRPSHSAALRDYARIARDHPRSRAVSLDYARALIGAGPAAGRQAAALLRPLLAGSDDPALYGLYARACAQGGDAVRAGEAEAAASYYADRPFDAMDQFQRLLARGDLDYYARARIQAQVTQLQPLLEELRRRHIGTDDSPATAAGD